jgi:hypothetical protein
MQVKRDEFVFRISPKKHPFEEKLGKNDAPEARLAIVDLWIKGLPL